MKLKKSKKFKDWVDLKPVTDEEFEELLNDPPKMKESRKSKKKLKKKEFYKDDLNF
ncbi:MAG: hypothetical protein J7K36_03420 [Archaeoglobaceae archaeon]|nr:hypothetical protein [Archaeoglobaceae archaeon]